MLCSSALYLKIDIGTFYHKRLCGSTPHMVKLMFGFDAAVCFINNILFLFFRNSVHRNLNNMMLLFHLFVCLFVLPQQIWMNEHPWNCVNNLAFVMSIVFGFSIGKYFQDCLYKFAAAENWQQPQCKFETFVNISEITFIIQSIAINAFQFPYKQANKQTNTHQNDFEGTALMKPHGMHNSVWMS